MQKNRMNRHRRRGMRSGFTLIEVITVVIIIAVLAALIAPRIIGRVSQSKVSVATANAATIRNQVKLWMADTGAIPKDGAELTEMLWEKPPGDQAANWKGPYIDSSANLIDPWGNAFQIRVPGQKNFDFDIVCLGADGKEGGADDDADIVQ